MNENKGVEIFVNEVSKYIIEEGNREISAKEIYDLLDYEYGDTFSVESENEKAIDEPVLAFFKELFDDICKRINEIAVNEKDDVLEMKENNKENIIKQV